MRSNRTGPFRLLTFAIMAAVVLFTGGCVNLDDARQANAQALELVADVGDQVNDVAHQVTTLQASLQAVQAEAAAEGRAVDPAVEKVLAIAVQANAVTDKLNTTLAAVGTTLADVGGKLEDAQDLTEAPLIGAQAARPFLPSPWGELLLLIGGIATEAFRRRSKEKSFNKGVEVGATTARASPTGP